MTNDEKIDKMLKFYHGTKTLKDYLLEMTEWKREQMIEKTIDWLDSIMDYVSEKDKRLVCNFTSFDELIDDYKKAMEE